MPPPTSTAEAVARLLQTPGLWRAGTLAPIHAQPTGFAPLDACLPGGGWPIGALTELVAVEDGIGEVRITLPAVRALCSDQRRVALIAPPHQPHPTALHRWGVPLDRVTWISPKTDEDALWAAVQLLKASSTGAVLLWAGGRDDRALRKLQLAAEGGRSLAFLFRSPDTLSRPSPAALRLKLRSARPALQVEIHKVRGGTPRITTVRMPAIRI